MESKSAIQEIINQESENGLENLTFRTIRERLLQLNDPVIVLQLEDQDLWSELKQFIKDRIQNRISTIVPKKSKPKMKTSPKMKKIIKASDNSKKVSKSKSIDTDSNEQIQQLKNYILKCGIRRVWKKELEGLTPSQSISKLKNVLKDLGMEGRPSLAKCEAIRERLEFEKEMEAIDTRNILPIGSKRSRDVQTSPKKQREERDDLDLSKLGDSE